MNYSVKMIKCILKRELFILRFFSHDISRAVFFAKCDLQPSIVVHPLLKAVEAFEIRRSQKSFADCVRKTFEKFDKDTGSSIWVFDHGVGIYIHPGLNPCSKHPLARKTGHYCVCIENGYKVKVVRCSAKRIE